MLSSPSYLQQVFRISQIKSLFMICVSKVHKCSLLLRIGLGLASRRSNFTLPIKKFINQMSFSVQRCGVHPINAREILSLSAASKIRNNPLRFFKYLRMSVETSDFLLSRLSHQLQKETTNYRQPILHAERLVVTIR